MNEQFARNRKLLGQENLDRPAAAGASAQQVTAGVQAKAARETS